VQAIAAVSRRAIMALWRREMGGVSRRKILVLRRRESIAVLRRGSNPARARRRVAPPRNALSPADFLCCSRPSIRLAESSFSIGVRVRFIAVGSLAFVPGCHVVDSKDWNLRQLHDDQGHHVYSGALEGDFQYFWRQKVAAPLLSAGSTLAVKSPSQIEDPAGECLDNLVDLEGFDASDPRVAGLQVQWFSRLAVEDPWRLSRERAIHALGRAGQRLNAGLPVGLAADAHAAGPEALGAALTALVKSARPVMEKGKHAGEMAELDFDSSCQLIEHMTLDIEGARRALLATVDLTRAAGLNNPAMAPLLRMNENLQRTCVRLGLAAGLSDHEPIVRAAAIESSVACAGTRCLIPILAQIGGEPSIEVLVRVMQLVREYGLPEPPAELAPADRNHLRESWIAAIYHLLDTRPETELHVAAMLALSRISDGALRSLREEDWQAWWARHNSPMESVPSERPGTARAGGSAP
jgi:hypothetical protein